MKLSIITINYNNLEGLKRTYDSVVSQTCQDFEWIIIDGGSTDGSREFIEEHQDKFAYWCSEPDKGIYNAMNKGIAKATGEYLQFLNSGDGLVDDKVIEEFISLCMYEDVILGDAILDGDEKDIKVHPDEENLDFDFLRYGGICHQASFIKKTLFILYGGYDEQLKIVSDWKFFLEVLIKHNCSYRHWNRFTVNYDVEGISSEIENQQLHWKERLKVLQNYERFLRSIRKRDRRIQELDLPIMLILKRKLLAKLRRLFPNKHERK